MKIYMIFLLLLSLMSNASAEQASIKKITAKCFVNLYGGQQTIYYRKIDPIKLANLAENLSGKMITTVYSNQKKKIYKVNECILKENEFSDAWARQIEAKTAQ